MQSTHQQAKRSGFTLIELLIVVAIIAILAAIAVPNFLEAQTRSKVSRVKADMRSLATAVTAYQVDFNGKVFRTNRAVGETREYLWGRVTTPVAYISSVPKDPFNTVDSVPGNRVIVIWGPDYLEGYNNPPGTPGPSPAQQTQAAKWLAPYPVYSDGTNLKRTYFWVMFSLGPDGLFSILHTGLDTPQAFSPPKPMIDYDATNGTISFGDVSRFQD